MRWLTAVFVCLAACSSPPAPPGPPKQIGGVTVSGEMLRDGAKIYAFRCATCHGQQGDGNGPTGRAQNTKPRDFRAGVIKFASVKAGQLATDADYARTITHGLKGTNMLALPMEPSEVEAVTQYVKSLSEKWTDPNAKAGTPIVMSPDPWTDSAAAVAEGKAIVKLRCTSCHATAENDGTASDSMYGWLKAPKLEPGMTFKAGSTLPDLYRTIGAGIGGTGMHALKDSTCEEELWAVVRYVESLATGK